MREGRGTTETEGGGQGGGGKSGGNTLAREGSCIKRARTTKTDTDTEAGGEARPSKLQYKKGVHAQHLSHRLR